MYRYVYLLFKFIKIMFYPSYLLYRSAYFMIDWLLTKVDENGKEIKEEA